MPTYTYTWADAEQTALIREDGQGSIVHIPADPGNRDYAAFLGSGDPVNPYVPSSTETPD